MKWKVFSELVFIFPSIKVVARFNEVVTKLLLEGAIETFKKYSVREEDIEVNLLPVDTYTDKKRALHPRGAIVSMVSLIQLKLMTLFVNQVIWVPGSFEIGVVAQNLGKSGKFNAVLCIGAVVCKNLSGYLIIFPHMTS